MQTIDFLRAILPSEGWYYSCEWVPKPEYKTKGFWKNTPHDSLESLAQALEDSSQRGINAYMSLAGFAQDAYYEEYNGKEKRKTRTQDNAERFRCMWLDIDVGASGTSKPFSSQREALQALIKFVNDSGLAKPTYIVSSGYGLHVYWVFDREISKDKWSWQAQRVKDIAHSMGFSPDDSRTTDSASVLRPVGANNYKNPDDPKPVTALHQGAIVDTKQWFTALYEQHKALNIKTKTVTKRRRVSHNDDLTGGMTSVPSCAEQLADKCPTIRAMRDSRGANHTEGMEPLWRACLGVLLYTEQGDAVCHEWSEGHPEYDEDACQAKIDARRDTPPSLCSTIRDMTGNKCQDCRYEVNTPIVLGYPEPTQTETEELEDGTSVPLPTLPPVLNRDFRFDVAQGGLMWRAPLKEVKGDAAPARDWVCICSALITLEYLYTDTDGEHYAHLNIRARPGVVEMCDIKVSQLAQGGTQLMGALGSGAGVIPNNPKGVTRFMQTWYDSLRQGSELQTMRRHMGWQTDGTFVLGNRMYTEDGEVKRCTLAKGVTKYAEAHEPIGSYEKQVAMIDALYNKSQREVYQFTLAASLGAVLYVLLVNDLAAVPIILCGSETGKGKTTVCKAAIGLWGDHKGNGQQANADGVTEFALYVMAGIRKHLPMLVDEASDWDAERSAKFAYRFSSGQSRVMGDPSGGLRDNSHLNWTNFIFITSNESIIGKVEATNKNPGPKIARLFEVQVPDIKLNVEDYNLVRELQRNTGHIGPRFLEYVVRNLGYVKKQLETMYSSLTKNVDDDSGARYWLQTAACVIVANNIANDIGVFHWGKSHLTKWIANQVRTLRRIADDTLNTVEEMTSMLFADIQPQLVVTHKWGDRDSRAAINPEFPPPRGRECLGRYITSTNELFVTTRAIKKWCVENSIAYKDLANMMTNAGVMQNPGAKKSLTAGTALGSVGQSRCWHLKFSQPQLHVVEVSSGA
jgi:hypothetical protein